MSSNNNSIIFIVFIPALIFIGRIEYIDSFMLAGEIVPFLTKLFISFLLLGIASILGFYYLFLNDLVFNGRLNIFRHALFSIMVPASIIGYEFDKIFSDKLLIVMYFVFIFAFVLFGKSAYGGFMAKIISIEESKGLSFPRKPPESSMDLIPYHIGAILFLSLPFLSPHAW